MESTLKMKIISVVLLILALSVSLPAMDFMGGRGLFYTQSALVNSPGMLSMNMFTRNYYKFISDGANISNGTAALAVNFGIKRHFEIALSQIMYQDLVIPKGSAGDLKYSQYPDDTFGIVKFGGFWFKVWNKPVFYGALLSFRYRIGNYDNVYLEPYSNYAISGRMDFLCSYYIDPSHPQETSSFHLNAGYINYNDYASLIESSQSMPFSLGYSNANLKREYSCELHGMYFLKRPIDITFSREHFIYIAPGFKYKLFKGLSIGAALDILVYTEDELTRGHSQLAALNYPKYAEWRLNIKVDYIPTTILYQIPAFDKVETSEPEWKMLERKRIITDYRSLIEWVVSEDKGISDLGLELQKLREERQKAEQEIEELINEIETKSSEKAEGK